MAAHLLASFPSCVTNFVSRVTVGPSMAVYGSPDGIIDCNGETLIEGGTFIALARSVGSGMEGCSRISGCFFPADISTDSSDEITITDDKGNALISFIPEIECSSILVLSDVFKEDCEYAINCVNSIFTYRCTDGITRLK